MKKLNLAAKSIIINGSFLISAQFMARIIRTIYIILLVRYLGSDIYGFFQYTQNWYVSFIPLTLLGFGAVLSREVGRNFNKGASLVRNGLYLRVFAGILCMIITFTLGYYLETNDEIKKLFIIFAFLVPARALLNWVKEVFIAYEVTRFHLIQTTISNITQVIACLIIIFFEGKILTIALTHIVILYIEFLISFIVIQRKVVTFSYKIIISSIIKLLRKGILIGVMLACNRWMLMGQVIIYRYIENSPTSLSYVALAMLLIFFCSLIIDSITHSSLPVISRLYQNHKKINKKILYNTLIAIIPIGLTIVILGKFIIPYLTALIFGANYYIAGDLFASLLWVLIPYSMSHITAQIFIIKNKVLTLASAAFISALLMTLVLPFAINIIGIYSGILYTTFIAFSLQFFILLFVNFKNE